MKPNCLIIAGEKSGEEHCLSFFQQLKTKCPQVKFWGVGGDAMNSIGFEQLYHLKDFSSWGVSEVITKIPFYLSALAKIENEVIKRDCKVAILIDFQSFNLRLARKLKKRGVKVLYYVAPQAWAWKAWRAGVLGEAVHTLFTIIPFEKEWFKSRGVDQVYSVKHPVGATFQNKVHRKLSIDESFDHFKKEINVVVLPGSRNFEVSNLLPKFIKVLSELKQDYPIRAKLVRASNVKPELYDVWSSALGEVIENEFIDHALNWADFSLAASGTVTLITALFELPTIVCYQSSLFNEYLYFTFVKYKGDISLANIVHQKKIFPELIQEAASTYNIKRSILKWINDRKEFLSVKSTLCKTKGLLQGELADVSIYLSDVINNVYVI